MWLRVRRLSKIKSAEKAVICMTFFRFPVFIYSKSKIT